MQPDQKLLSAYSFQAARFVEVRLRLELNFFDRCELHAAFDQLQLFFLVCHRDFQLAHLQEKEDVVIRANTNANSLTLSISLAMLCISARRERSAR